MLTLKTILDDINIRKANRGPSEITSGNRYQITLQRKKKSLKQNPSLYAKPVYFDFHDNYMNKCDNEDIISSLVLDAKCYECNGSVEDFMKEFGYNYYTEAKRVYNACKKHYDQLNKLFTKEEVIFLKENL